MIKKSISLEYEPSSEPLHISVKQLFLNQELQRSAQLSGCFRRLSLPGAAPDNYSGTFRNDYTLVQISRIENPFQGSLSTSWCKFCGSKSVFERDGYTLKEFEDLYLNPGPDSVLLSEVPL